MAIMETGAEILRDMDNFIKEQALKEFFYASLLTASVSEIETDINPIWKKMVQTRQVNEGSTIFVSELVKMLDVENHPFNPMLKRHLGRPVYTLDCCHLCYKDAISWLEKVANLPKSPKPILVIENITEIPEEYDKHGNPLIQTVRNLLLHNWKNPMTDLFNSCTQDSFRIVPADYTVFITYTPENREKMDAIRQPSDGFAQPKKLEKFLEDYKNDSLKDLENKHIVSYKDDSNT